MSTLHDKMIQPPEVSVGFPRNLAIIRPVAWIVGFLALAGVECLMWIGGFERDPKLHAWPLLGQLGFSAAIGLVVLADVLLIGFIYADAKRRSMRHVMWTLLALFIPDAIGIILYFLLREPLPAPCPRCGFLARGGFSFCPRCGSDLLHTCHVCHRKMEPGWSNCAYCGAAIKPEPVRQS
jgi:RNA polymerase subunit RPABC4/transcription elongation factor Spt4